MHLKGKEKHFWRNHFNIGSLSQIPAEIKNFRSIDSEVDDAFLFFLTSRIANITELYFKFTLITDVGVQHISSIQNLRKLTLREHKNITNESIPYLNKLVDLEYLDILKTEIQLEDGPGLFNLRNLKELYITSDNLDEEYHLEHIIAIKKLLPNCILYINYESYE